MASVFGGHDRSRLEVFCYALSPSGQHSSLPLRTALHHAMSHVTSALDSTALHNTCMALHGAKTGTLIPSLSSLSKRSVDTV